MSKKTLFLRRLHRLGIAPSYLEKAVYESVSPLDSECIEKPFREKLGESDSIKRK